MIRQTKPRLGIVLTKFGFASEIWAVRQAEAMTAFEPVYFADSIVDGGLELPEGRELILFDPPKISLYRRALRKAGLPAGVLRDRATSSKIKHIICNARVDALLCHFMWNAAILSNIFEREVPLVGYAHGMDLDRNLIWPAHRQALKRTLPRLSGLVVVGSHQKRILESMGSPLEPVVIPCGAPVEFFAQHPIPIRTPGDRMRFISIGRLSEEKGHFETIRAFEDFCGAYGDGVLTIIGDGPLRQQIESRVSQSPFKANIRLLGRRTSQEILEELSISHCFLHHFTTASGFVEGFGVVLAEAGSAGLPLVASSVGGILDQVTDGHNGILFPPGDTEAQTRAMLVLARNESLRQAMGKQAREAAASFDSVRLAHKLQDYLLGILSDGPLTCSQMSRA